MLLCAAPLLAPCTFLFGQDEQRVAAAFVNTEGLSGAIVPFRRLQFPCIVRGLLRTFEGRSRGQGVLHSRLELCRREECVRLVDIGEGPPVDYARHLCHSPLSHARGWRN